MSFAFFLVVETRESGVGGDIRERTRIPGEQTDEKDRETGERYCQQTGHTRTGTTKELML